MATFVLEELSISELRDLIDETAHQVGHLTRSQQELATALNEDPTDSDFLLAIQENEAIIEDKKANIERWTSILRQKDPAFRIESESASKFSAEEIQQKSAAQPPSGNAETKSIQQIGLYL